MVSACFKYKKLKTPFDVRKSATTLIITGPNKFSRNPGYLSLTLLYLGIGFVLSNVWIIVLAAPLIVIMNLYIIANEEKQLESLFGKEYLEYKSKVRKWI